MSSSGKQLFRVVDVEAVTADDASAAVKTFELDRKPKIVRCDVFIAGGGMGGIAAAIRAAQAGMNVCMTEETGWIGGQMTSQAVSALDENYLVETSGATRLYQKMRKEIRKHYRELPGVKKEAAANELLNPGLCWVTRLSFEPEVGLEVLEELIAAETKGNPPRLDVRTKVVSVRLDKQRIKSALAVDLDSGTFIEFRARFFIDATELGDLLPLAGVPYVSGAESRAETGEPHAPAEANPENVQDFTYPFVLVFDEGKKYSIPKPKNYDKFNSAGKFSFLGYKMFSNAKVPGKEHEYLPFWTYRRLVAADIFDKPYQDLSMINWEANDVRGENIIDKDPATQAERLAIGKQISLGFLYWLQHEAPRDDGGIGYPELRLIGDVLGTSDGLSKYPYIRESRRFKAIRTITEQDIASATISGARAKLFDDTIGIGLYPIDIHGHQDVPGAGQAAKPFQIPLSAMVQKTVRNLIPACKNIGTTHVTNGAYRLHPIEWAIGEAAGNLAALCVQKRTIPLNVLRNQLKLRTLQKRLVEQGAPLYWYDDVPTNHPSFAAIQYASVSGSMNGIDGELSFRPEAKLPEQNITRAEAAQRLYDASTNAGRRLISETP